MTRSLLNILFSSPITCAHPTTTPDTDHSLTGCIILSIAWCFCCDGQWVFSSSFNQHTNMFAEDGNDPRQSTELESAMEIDSTPNPWQRYVTPSVFVTIDNLEDVILPSNNSKLSFLHTLPAASLPAASFLSGPSSLQPSQTPPSTQMRIMTSSKSSFVLAEFSVYSYLCL